MKEVAGGVSSSTTARGREARAVVIPGEVFAYDVGNWRAHDWRDLPPRQGTRSGYTIVWLLAEKESRNSKLREKKMAELDAQEAWKNRPAQQFFHLGHGHHKMTIVFGCVFPLAFRVLGLLQERTHALHVI